LASHGLRTLYRDPLGCRLGFPAANRRFSLAPPLRFLPLQRSRTSESVSRPVPSRAPSLFDLSQVLEGFLLTGSCGPISCRCRSWGSALQSLTPTGELFWIRHPAIPSRCFSGSPKRSGRTPRGFRRPAIRIRTRSIASEVGPMLSWAFTSLPWLSGTLVGTSVEVHPPLAFSSGLFMLIPEAGLQRLRSKGTGVSCSRRRRPS